jgi:hypothetical protein
MEDSSWEDRNDQERKGRGGEREWLTTIMTAMQEKAKEGRRDGRGGTGEEGPGSVQHAKTGRGGCTNRCWHGRSARE